MLVAGACYHQFPRMSLLGSSVNSGNRSSLEKFPRGEAQAGSDPCQLLRTKAVDNADDQCIDTLLVRVVYPGGSTMEVIDVVGVGALLVGIATLVVVVLTLRSAQRAVQLAEARNEYLREEQKRLDQLREQHKTLNEELVRERQERWSLQEQLNQEQGERLEAERRAEQAEQEALRGATKQLREQMNRYIQDLEKDTRSGTMRRIK